MILKSNIYAIFMGVVLGSVLPQTAVATEFEAAQEGKKFTVKHLKIKVGDTIHFPNKDSFFHNVYSLSPTQIFDLGSYAKGETRSVKFNRVGYVEVECAIHPRMYMTIEITED